MGKMKLYKNIFGIIAVSLMTVLAMPLLASAQTDSTAQGLQVSPARVELNATRGKTYTINLKVINVTAATLEYNTSVADFNASDETGSPHLLEDSNLPATASIKSWVSEFPSFELASQQEKNLDVQITIPNNAEAGGHYGVLRFSGSEPNVVGTGVGLSASAGVLMLIRVDGAITEKASLASFFTAGSDGKQNSFFENSPITFVTRVKNDGNVHIKPVGNVQVTDMFGGVVTTLQVNSEVSNVLPSSIRRFESNMDKPWMFGLYTANLTVGYGMTGQAITNTITFWVIPYKIILAGLFIIATIVFILKRMLKVYNKRIIENHKNENSKNKNNSKKKG